MKQKHDSSKQGNVIASYLSSLNKIPQLNHPEVVELFQTYESGGVPADKARSKLIESNLRLVVSIAKQYKGHNIPLEDLIQEGNLGLMKSIERFDWKRGFRFSTYASYWIKQAIGQHVLKRKRIVRLPAHAAHIQRRMIQAAEEFKEATGIEPNADELTEMLGASATVVKATMHSGKGTISLSQPISSSGEGDCIEDRVEDERPGASPFENVSDKQLLSVVKEVLATLSPKEAAILRLRFGLVEDECDHESYPITAKELKHLSQGKGMT